MRLPPFAKIVAFVSLIVLALPALPAGADHHTTGQSNEVVVRPIAFPVRGPVGYSDTWGACRGTNCSRPHEGTDIMGNRLQPLVAAMDGYVISVRVNGSNMLAMIDDAGWQYWYIHINNDTPGTDDGANPHEWILAPGIQRWSRVHKGEHIAYLGDSGNAESTAPHLHFEIHKPDGTPVNPYWSLIRAPIVEYTPPLAGDRPTLSGDFDGDGTDELLVYGPGSARDHLLTPSSTQGRYLGEDLVVNGTFEPFIGDFDGDGADEIFWYAPGPAADYLWDHAGGESAGEWESTRLTVNGTYQPVVGDFDGNGYDDIIWYAPGPAPDYEWRHHSDGYESIRRTINGTYLPIVGDWTGVEQTESVGDEIVDQPRPVDDILWYAPGPAPDYRWVYDSGSPVSTPQPVGGTYEPVVGDFDGNGIDDIFWYGAGDTADSMWIHETPGQPTSHRYDVRGHYRPLATDFDGDGSSEIVWNGAGGRDYLWSFRDDLAVRSDGIVVRFF